MFIQGAGRAEHTYDAIATLLELANNTRDPRYAQRATEAALFARNEAQALEAARLWLALEPDAIAARQSLAALLVSQRKLSEAKSHLQFLLAADSANPGRGFLQLNALLSKQVDKQAVLVLVKELAQPYPNLPEAQIAIAQAAWNAGDTELGLAAARQALALRPDWEAGVLFQGQMLQSRSAAEAWAMRSARGSSCSPGGYGRTSAPVRRSSPPPATRAPSALRRSVGAAHVPSE